MAKFNSLSVLIQALTKAEKRSVKLYAAVQQGEKDYICLFDILDKGNTGQRAKDLFRKAKPGASYEATCKYLYKVVTDCLLQMRLEQDKTTKLIASLLKAEILFERSLYEQGFRQLKAVQASAELHEQHIIQFWATKLELANLHKLNFDGVSEHALISKHRQIQEVFNRERLITEHSALYELLRHRLLYKGNVRTKKQKDELNDLVMAELSLTRNPLAETFESAKTHLLFQAQYFLTVNDYGSALKTFYELNELFEENEYIWIDSPDDYLASIEGIVDSLKAIKRYKEIDFFLDKLYLLKKRTAEVDVRIESIVFIYKTAALLDTAGFDQAKLLLDSMKISLFGRLHLLDVIKQAQVYMFAALIYFSRGDMNKAYEYLNEILSKRGVYNNFTLYRTFRLLHILVHYELGNHDYIVSEVRSIKREVAGASVKSYSQEKILFWFVQQPLPVDPAARKRLWLKANKKFESVHDARYQLQILQIFDFVLWVKAKIFRQSYGVLLRERVNAESEGA